MLPFSLPGFEIQEVSCTPTGIRITACATGSTAACPTCQQISHRIHSYYHRAPQDLPVSGQAVRLSLQVRRFRCQNRACQKQSFVEPLPAVVPRYSRQTKRLKTTLRLFALFLSGQAASRLLKQLGMPVSGETLLRMLKQSTPPQIRAPEILGVDDFAFKRGRRYGNLYLKTGVLRMLTSLSFTN